MHIRPQTSREWFDFVRFTFKVGVISAVVVLLVEHHIMASIYQTADGVHGAMETVAQPVEVFCLMVGLFLLVAGIVELFRHRQKKAIWDFVFLVLALFCWQLAEAFTVAVR